MPIATSAKFVLKLWHPWSPDRLEFSAHIDLDEPRVSCRHGSYSLEADQRLQAVVT
jgi:hypothetical protein